MNQSRVCAVLLAGGSGTRMNLDRTKQRLLIKGESVLSRTVSAFENCEEITDIILVVKAEDLDFALSETSGRFPKLRKVVEGAKCRALSAKNGFSAIDFPCDFVAIHDVARCLVKPKMITKVVFDAFKYGAASASVAVTDTVKRVSPDGFAFDTINRDELRLAATPQIFKCEFYRRALSEIDVDDPSITDDNMLMERLGISVFMTDTGKNNIKVTYAEDIEYAEYLLGGRNV